MASIPMPTLETLTCAYFDPDECLQNGPYAEVPASYFVEDSKEILPESYAYFGTLHVPKNTTGSAVQAIKQLGLTGIPFENILNDWGFDTSLGKVGKYNTLSCIRTDEKRNSSLIYCGEMNNDTDFKKSSPILKAIMKWKGIKNGSDVKYYDLEFFAVSEKPKTAKLLAMNLVHNLHVVYGSDVLKGKDIPFEFCKGSMDYLQKNTDYFAPLFIAYYTGFFDKSELKDLKPR